MKETIKELLLATKKEGIEKLIEWMESNGFFTAPCSGSYHLSVEGGLAEHSLNVFKTLVELDKATGADIDYTSMVLCALLHDLGKCGDHGKPNYIPSPLLKSGKAPAKPYKTNSELIYEEHEIRSLLIAERFIELSEEEETAILHHNGLFGKLDSSYGNHNYDSSKLAFLLHTADMYCSRFIEVEEKGEEE